MFWFGLIVTLLCAAAVATVFLFAELGREKREIEAPPSFQRAGTHDTLVSHWEAA